MEAVKKVLDEESQQEVKVEGKASKYTECLRLSEWNCCCCHFKCAEFSATQITLSCTVACTAVVVAVLVNQAANALLWG